MRGSYQGDTGKMGVPIKDYIGSWQNCVPFLGTQFWGAVYDADPGRDTFLTTCLGFRV